MTLNSRNAILWQRGVTHSVVNPYYHLSDHIIHIFLLADTVLYLNLFFVLPRNRYDPDVQLGIGAIIILAVFVTKSRLLIVCKQAYHKIFTSYCAFFSFLLIPIISIHVPYKRRYILQVLIVSVSNMFTPKPAPPPHLYPLPLPSRGNRRRSSARIYSYSPTVIRLLSSNLDSWPRNVPQIRPQPHISELTVHHRFYTTNSPRYAGSGEGLLRLCTPANGTPSTQYWWLDHQLAASTEKKTTLPLKTGIPRPLLLWMV